MYAVWHLQNHQVHKYVYDELLGFQASSRIIIEDKCDKKHGLGLFA